MIRFHCGWGANNKWFWDLFPPIDQLCGHYCQRWTIRKPLEIFSNEQFLPSIDKQLRKTDLCKSKKPASLDLVALTVRSQACCRPCCSEEPVSLLKKISRSCSWRSFGRTRTGLTWVPRRRSPTWAMMWTRNRARNSPPQARPTPVPGIVRIRYCIDLWPR